MQTILLLVLAIVPAILFLVLILFMDRNEREPLGMVMAAIGLGVLSAIPAIILEMLIGMIPIFKIGGLLGAFLVSFIQVSPVEEICKLGVILLFIYNRKNFNEENDGIVYVGSSALGFAAFENIFYVLEGGLSTGILRAFTALPLHIFTGVIMGYFVGLAKFADNKKKTFNLIFIGFLIAFLIHGAYDTFALSNSYIAALLIPLVIALIVFGIIFLIKGRKLSLKRWANQDANTINQATEIDYSKYKSIRRYIWKIIVGAANLGIVVFLWMILIFGYLIQSGESETTNLGELFAGGTVITFIPFVIGIVLLISFILSAVKVNKYKNKTILETTV